MPLAPSQLACRAAAQFNPKGSFERARSRRTARLGRYRASLKATGGWTSPACRS